MRPTTTTTAPPPPGSEVLIAAGDIGACSSQGDEATAALVAAREGTVATLGDTAYEKGTAAEFASCYAPTWGQFKARTRPAPGNHDYSTRNAAGYFGYFGAAAGTAGEGWYSYDLGDWHIVVLNSNCGVGCGAGSRQGRWLRADLARHPATCTLAYWHHPRFSSGIHGSTPEMAELFGMLHEAGADLVLAGHDHDYERLAPLDPNGVPDPQRGIRSFVVGTGGHSFYPIFGRLPGSEVRYDESFGVLVLTLEPTAYRWEFVTTPGHDFRDAGTGACH
ncbi:MAG: acid phosphatase type 7 [Actinomycetota bacterium]